MSIAAMKQALDYLRLARDYGIALGAGNTTIDDAIRDLLAAITEAEKCEPVAWLHEEDTSWWVTQEQTYDENERPLYLHPAPVPAGWQLVPVEPTEEMLIAGWGKDFRYTSSYPAMLAAAPKP